MGKKPGVTLWLLNRCARWPHEPLVRALSKQYEVELGRRVRARPGRPAHVTDSRAFVRINDAEDSAPGELMHEGANLPRNKESSRDEYFVPIPLKCVGDLDSAFWQSAASTSGKKRLTELGANLRGRFGGRGRDVAGAEAVIGKHFRRVGMNLANPSIGYYEILQRAKAQTGADNVLVGYSQGGAVARYLAFLDEYVVSSEQSCIRGIVTVQAPNAGSPVASASKKSDVGRALAAVALSLVRWLPPNFLTEGSALDDWLRDAEVVDATNGILDALVHSWPSSPHVDRWLSARKWLSGLEGNPELAFWDLDPATACEVGSVLHAISSFPLKRVLHGAVVGCDASLADFVRSLLSNAPLLVRAAARLSDGRVRRLTAEAEAIYRDVAMSFQNMRGVDHVVSGGFGTGMAAVPIWGLDRPLAPGAHDFVIPSVSQMLLPVTRAHLGNLVMRANHLSGAAGADLPCVVELLEKM